MQILQNITLPGSNGKPIAIDIYLNGQPEPLPVVIYAHGFNGFKTWGNFSLIAQRFVQNGFAVVALNFSHNGTTPGEPETFTNLDAFGNNNYTKQLNDLHLLTNWICDANNDVNALFDTSRIGLIGHSMGGGISILFAHENNRITRLVTWAAISQCKTPWGNWPPEKIAAWQQSGVEYYYNGRTRQQMPLYYQLHEDYLQNELRLNIQNAAAALNIPWLICHGTADAAVPVQSAYELQQWQPRARLFTVGSDHVFGRSHPWPHHHLPAAMEAVLEQTIAFLKQPQ